MATALEQLSAGRRRSADSALDRVLLTPPAGGGIDFMAIARGRQAGREANLRDRLQNLRQKLLAEAIEDREDKRQAYQYLSSLASNRQIAARAGVPAGEFLIQQQQQALADPNFQRLSPAVQNLINTGLGQAAALQAQRLRKEGNESASERLTQHFGLSGLSTPVDRLRNSVSPQDYVDALNRANPGANYAIDADGNIDIGGIKVPATLAMSQALSAGSLSGGLLAARDQLAKAQATPSWLNNFLKSLVGGREEPAPTPHGAVPPIPAAVAEPPAAPAAAPSPTVKPPPDAPTAYALMRAASAAPALAPVASNLAALSYLLNGFGSEPEKKTPHGATGGW